MAGCRGALGRLFPGARTVRASRIGFPAYVLPKTPLLDRIHSSLRSYKMHISRISSLPFYAFEIPELRRIPLLGIWVNMGKKKGRGRQTNP